MGHLKSNSQTEVYSNTGLPQETSQINDLALYVKEIENEEQSPKVSRRKIREEINKIETKKTKV